MKKPIVSPSFLKQKARQLKKSKSLTQSEALNEASQELGFSNYKNYLNALESSRPEPPDPADFEMEIWEQMNGESSKRIAIVDSLLQKLKLPFGELLDSLEQARHWKTRQSICEKYPELKEFIRLHIHMDSLEDEGGSLELISSYHLPKEAEVKNLVFRLGDDLLLVEGDYELKLDFAFEHEPNDPHPLLEDRSAWGSFELTIDRNKTLTIEHSDIGWEN